MRLSKDDETLIVNYVDEFGAKLNYNYRFVDRGNYTELTDGEKEFYIYENYEAAKEAAKESMRDLFDDIGITAWNEDFIESIVPDEIVDFVRPAYEAVKNNNDYSLSRAGAWEKYLDQIFEESISADGLGNTLSAYDGEELQVNDYHIYRWN
tara:strand:+ start:255 stop:710 length:456 start_codon:yes stop_codon:yes gene_type:complete